MKTLGPTKIAKIINNHANQLNYMRSDNIFKDLLTCQIFVSRWEYSFWTHSTRAHRNKTPPMATLYFNKLGIIFKRT